MPDKKFQNGSYKFNFALYYLYQKTFPYYLTLHSITQGSHSRYLKERLKYKTYLETLNNELTSKKSNRRHELLQEAENTHSLDKEKNDCTADILFDWFGISCFVM